MISIIGSRPNPLTTTMCSAFPGCIGSRMGIAPISVACEDAVKHAERMQYGSCAEGIRELAGGKRNYLKLYFL